MDRETALEIGVGAVGVGAFIAAMLVVGTLHGEGALNAQDGYTLIGVIVGFVVFMSGLGHWLSRKREKLD